MKIKSSTGYAIVLWSFIILTLIAYVNLFVTIINGLIKIF